MLVKNKEKDIKSSCNKRNVLKDLFSSWKFKCSENLEDAVSLARSSVTITDTHYQL